MLQIPPRNHFSVDHTGARRGRMECTPMFERDRVILRVIPDTHICALEVNLRRLDRDWLRQWLDYMDEEGKPE